MINNKVDISKETNDNEPKYRRIESENNIASLNSDLAQAEWQDVFSENNINHAYDKFLHKLLFYYDKNIPLVKTKTKERVKNPWITKGILRSIHIRNRLFKLTKTNPSVININKYKRYRNKLTSVIRLARKTYYSNELNKNKNNTNSVWKLINTLIGKNSKTDNTDTFCHNDIQFTNPTEVCNTFNDYFTNIGPNLAEQINTNNGHFTQYLSTPSEKSLFFNPTNVHEILDIVKSLNSSRSSGFDGISVCLLKKIIHNIVDPLSHIFNLSLSTGICPNSLKIAKIIPIFKKDDPSQISNYRPISLLPGISKVLEKIIYKRLYMFLINNKILIPNQYGFRKNHSTDYALINLCDKIVNALSNKEHMIGIFLDLSKAFDTINHQILLYKLKTYGIRGIAYSWFENYLSNRSQYVAFKSHESMRLDIKCGVPQGSILGPLLFLIYINDIIHSSPLLTYILFADDTNLFYSHKNLNTLTTTLNCEVDKVSKWFKCNKLSLNINKTCCIYFSHNRSHNAPIHDPILIDGSPLSFKDSTKFLGVTIDSHLSWDNHIHNICNSVSRATGILYKLRYLLDDKTLFMLYNALILPHLNYCNIVWGNSATTKLNSILLLQKRAIRVCTRSGYLAETEPLFRCLKTLKIFDINLYQTAFFMHKYNLKLLPSAFQNLFHRNTDVHTYPTRHSRDFHLNNPKILLAHKSIRHNGPDIWNALHTVIKECKSLLSFKVLMKNNLLLKYAEKSR